MEKIFYCLGAIILIFSFSTIVLAQKHMANGEDIETEEGNLNRLISVKSANGKQLYQPGRSFIQQKIEADGIMDESDWEQALVVTPFINKNGEIDKTSVSILYDRDNIYLFWKIKQPDGVTIKMNEKDGVITSDDYVQVDLKPWLPDSISNGRDYSYSIAVNPKGIIWDSYFDPYLGGFYSCQPCLYSLGQRQSHNAHYQRIKQVPY